MKMDEVEDEQLEKEIELFFQAAYRYREFIKRNHRDRLAGVLIARSGNSTILFSERAKYSNQICNLIWDKNSDAFNAIKEDEEVTEDDGGRDE